MTQASLGELLKRIPGPASPQSPSGERYALAFSQGSMSVGFYAPVGVDPQGPHRRDEVYIIHSGSGKIRIRDEIHACAAGDVFFVASGYEHRFEEFSADFSTWVVFWGPAGGEAQAVV